MNKNTKTIIDYLQKDREIQIFESVNSIWVDFDGLKHGKLIFQEDLRFRIKPQQRAYYYARFENGSRTEIQDTVEAVKMLAESKGTAEFTIEKLIHDLSYENDGTHFIDRRENKS